MPASSLLRCCPRSHSWDGRTWASRVSSIRSWAPKSPKPVPRPDAPARLIFLKSAGRESPKPELIFTDLPGYGYAKISREISQQWPSFIDPYLKDRPCLALCVVLIDVNVPPQPADRQLLDFLVRNRTADADRRDQERSAFGQPAAQRASDSGPGISGSSHSALFCKNRSRTPGTLAGNPEADFGLRTSDFRPRPSDLGSLEFNTVHPQ